MHQIIKNKIRLLVKYTLTDNLQIKDSILKAYCDKFGAIGICELEADLAIYSQEIEKLVFLIAESPVKDKPTKAEIG